MNSDNHKKVTYCFTLTEDRTQLTHKREPWKSHIVKTYTDLFIVWWEDKYSSISISRAQRASLKVYSQLIASYRLKRVSVLQGRCKSHCQSEKL